MIPGVNYGSVHPILGPGNQNGGTPGYPTFQSPPAQGGPSGSQVPYPGMMYGEPQPVAQPPQQQPAPTLNPSTIQGQFPTGIPQLTAPQIMGTALDPQQAVSAMQAYMLPQFQQQQQGLLEALASAGIVGGATGKALQDLGSGQQSQLMSDIQPYVLGNQQLGQQAQEYNAGSLTGSQQFNINNLLNTAGTDANTYNNFLQFLLGGQNNDWLAQLGAVSNLNAAGAGASTAAFQPVFQQPQPFNLGGVASMFSTPTSADTGMYGSPTGNNILGAGMGGILGGVG